MNAAIRIRVHETDENTAACLSADEELLDASVVERSELLQQLLETHGSCELRLDTSQFTSWRTFGPDQFLGATSLPKVIQVRTFILFTG